MVSLSPSFFHHQPLKAWRGAPMAAPSALGCHPKDSTLNKGERGSHSCSRPSPAPPSCSPLPSPAGPGCAGGAAAGGALSTGALLCSALCLRGWGCACRPATATAPGRGRENAFHERSGTSRPPALGPQGLRSLPGPGRSPGSAPRSAQAPRQRCDVTAGPSGPLPPPPGRARGPRTPEPLRFHLMLGTFKFHFNASALATHPPLRPARGSLLEFMWGTKLLPR